MNNIQYSQKARVLEGQAAPVSVCYVEDEDESFINALTRSLTKDNYATVQIVRNIQGFLDRFVKQKSAYDVLLLDRYVDNIDMLSFLPHLHQTYPRMSILVITSFADLESMTSARKMGASGFFCKHKAPLKDLCEEVRHRIEDEVQAQKRNAEFIVGDNVPSCKTLTQVDKALVALEAQLLIKLMKNFETMNAAIEASGVTRDLFHRRLARCGLRSSMITKRGAYSQKQIDDVVQALQIFQPKTMRRPTRVVIAERKPKPEPKPKRPRGRPRKVEVGPPKPKRPPGRPRKVQPDPVVETVAARTPKKKTTKTRLESKPLKSKKNSSKKKIKPKKKSFKKQTNATTKNDQNTSFEQPELPLAAPATARQAAPSGSPAPRPRMIIRRRAHEIEAEQEAQQG
jgi:FixJ family two-component response regulator